MWSPVKSRTRHVRPYPILVGSQNFSFLQYVAARTCETWACSGDVLPRSARVFGAGWLKSRQGITRAWVRKVCNDA